MAASTGSMAGFDRSAVKVVKTAPLMTIDEAMEAMPSSDRSCQAPGTLTLAANDPHHRRSVHRLTVTVRSFCESSCATLVAAWTNASAVPL